MKWYREMIIEKTCRTFPFCQGKGKPELVTEVPKDHNGSPCFFCKTSSGYSLKSPSV